MYNRYAVVSADGTLLVRERVKPGATPLYVHDPLKSVTVTDIKPENSEEAAVSLLPLGTDVAALFAKFGCRVNITGLGDGTVRRYLRGNSKDVKTIVETLAAERIVRSLMVQLNEKIRVRDAAKRGEE